MEEVTGGKTGTLVTASSECSALPVYHSTIALALNDVANLLVIPANCQIRGRGSWGDLLVPVSSLA